MLSKLIPEGTKGEDMNAFGLLRSYPDKGTVDESGSGDMSELNVFGHPGEDRLSMHHQISTAHLNFR